MDALWGIEKIRRCIKEYWPDKEIPVNKQRLFDWLYSRNAALKVLEIANDTDCDEHCIELYILELEWFAATSEHEEISRRFSTMCDAAKLVYDNLLFAE